MSWVGVSGERAFETGFLQWKKYGKIASSNVREVPSLFCSFGEGEGSNNLHSKLPPSKKMTLVYDNLVGLVENNAAELVFYAFPCQQLPQNCQTVAFDCCQHTVSSIQLSTINFNFDHGCDPRLRKRYQFHICLSILPGCFFMALWETIWEILGFGASCGISMYSTMYPNVCVYIYI